MSGAEFQQKVKGLLGRAAVAFGPGEFNVTINRPAPQPENPWDAPAGSPVPYQVRASVEEYRQDQIDGTLIRAGDMKILMEGKVIDPTTADRVLINSGPYAGEYAIVRVQAEAPAGVALLYMLQVRR